MPDKIYPPFEDRCRREMTRDVVFVLRRRELKWLGCPDGYERTQEDEWNYVVEEGTPEAEWDEKQLGVTEVFKQQLRFSTDDADLPAVLAEWVDESVWLSREEAEAFAEQHSYNYRHGWIVYGLCSEGALAQLLKGT